MRLVVSRWAAAGLLACTIFSAKAASPTFARDIAAIIYRNCTPCHRAGESGPFSLANYDDVKKRAAQIAAVTRSGYMPPWLPQHGYGDFADERRLTPREIDMIADWASNGAPQGSPAETPPPPDFNASSPKPDLLLEAANSFTVPASGPDVYWNFVFTPDIESVRFVRAVEIHPGERQLVHHANLLIDRMGSSPASGFPGMDLQIMRSPFDPDGNFLFWKPGAARHEEPDGFAWRLAPGNRLVLNAHFHPSGKAEQVKPSIALYFTSKPPTKFPLLVQMENDTALNIPAGAANFAVADEFQLPMDVDILAIYPHAHYLGKVLEAYATLPDGSRKWLIRIPDWDPSWQAVYYYREPVRLPKGAVVSMRYRYDNSSGNVRNPNHPSRRVHAGDQSTDEMAHLWLQILPTGAGDRRRELQEAVMEHRLEKNPEDFTARMNLGAVMLSRLNPQGAVSMLQAAVRIDPARAEAHDMLGLALAETGRSREAAAQFELALKTQPGFLSARFNLAAIELKIGALDDAIENLKVIAVAQPDNQLVKERLAQAIAARGR